MQLTLVKNIEISVCFPFPRGDPRKEVITLVIASEVGSGLRL